VLGEIASRQRRQIAASGEKDPVENLVTVARRHREETGPNGRFKLTIAFMELEIRQFAHDTELILAYLRID
jgi:hypothetical protein